MSELAAASLTYEIDRHDRLIAVGATWDRFALRNDANDLLASGVLGRPLWALITDSTIEGLYRPLLDRVRSGLPVGFPFRCDSPTERREMEMRIAGSTDGGVRFTTRARSIHARPLQPLLDRQAPRGPGQIALCSWCKRLDSGAERWVEIEDAAAQGLFAEPYLPAITHGICPACDAGFDAV